MFSLRFVTKINVRCSGRYYSKYFSDYNNTFLPHKNEDRKNTVQFLKYETRPLSVLKTHVVSSPIESMVSPEERDGFLSAFSDIIRDFTQSDQYSDIPEVTKHFARVLEYNVTTGKQKRVHSFINAYKAVERPEYITPENIRLAYILGCCLEMCQAMILMIDDITDKSETRRGLPCWYLAEGVGLMAANDSMTVMSGVFAIIKKYFSRLRCYIPILELINDIILKITLGQTLDNISVTNGKPQLEPLSKKRYRQITKYKTSYFVYQFPLFLALNLANISEPEIYQEVKRISVELGHHYQAENDIMDCYGNPGIKLGNDIREGKCTWLIVEALGRATPVQRKILEANYGKPVVECEQVVRHVYDEMDMMNNYFSYKEESFKAIRSAIEQSSSGRLQKVMFELLENEYGMRC